VGSAALKIQPAWLRLAPKKCGRLRGESMSPLEGPIT
jgi:hypothetical protein